MVATLPSKAPKGVTSAPIASVPSNGDDQIDSLPDKDTPTPTKHVGIIQKVRNHHRSHTGNSDGKIPQDHSEDAKKLNRVLMVLMRRLGSSKTFGENVIFMLNRAGESSSEQSN